MKKQVTFRVLTAVAVLFCAGGAAQAALTWDFYHDGSGDDNGWTAENGGMYFRAGDGDGMTPANSGGGFAHDGAHTTLVAQSPAFSFDGTTLSGSTVFQWQAAGGPGDQGGGGAAFGTQAEVVAYNGGNSNSSGEKGLAFLNTTTGAYDAVLFKGGNGGTPVYSLTAADLTSAGVNLSQQYRLQFYENDDGSWGWGQLNYVNIAGNTGPVTDYIGGDGTISSRTLDGTQSNGTYGGTPSGRFVQVKNNGTANRRMDIGEIEAFATGDIPTVDNAGDNQPLNPTIDLAFTGNGASNYAQGADSGFYQPHGGNTLNLINAQETDGAATWSSQGVGNFVTIDLGNTFEIGTVRVHQRNGCCNDRLRDFSVNIFADDGSGNPGTLLSSSSYPGQPANERFGELTFATLLGADLTAELASWDAGAGYTYVFDIGSQDQLIVGDNGQPGVFTTIMDLNNALFDIRLLTGGGPYNAGDVFQLLVADTITGNLNDIILPTLPGGLSFDTSGLAAGGDGTLKIVSVIPEPMTMLAVGMGIASIGGYIRKRRRA